eukprot:COSAG06_NODE_30294_length_541_cov_1.047511_2_plen_131_part_01
MRRLQQQLDAKQLGPPRSMLAIASRCLELGENDATVADRRGGDPAAIGSGAMSTQPLEQRAHKSGSVSPSGQSAPPSEREAPAPAPSEVSQGVSPEQEAAVSESARLCELLTEYGPQHANGKTEETERVNT